MYLCSILPHFLAFSIISYFAGIFSSNIYKGSIANCIFDVFFTFPSRKDFCKDLFYILAHFQPAYTVKATTIIKMHSICVVFKVFHRHYVIAVLTYIYILFHPRWTAEFMIVLRVLFWNPLSVEWGGHCASAQFFSSERVESKINFISISEPLFIAHSPLCRMLAAFLWISSLTSSDNA